MKKTLLELRKERNINQSVVQDLLKVCRKTVYNWEHCRFAPDHWQLKTLCDFYACKKEDVIIAPRHDPLGFLPDDMTKEEYKEKETEIIMQIAINMADSWIDMIEAVTGNSMFIRKK